MAGRIYGQAGKGLENADWAANDDVARIGQSGEVKTSRIINHAVQGTKAVALHDLRIPLPGVRANIDHVLITHNGVYLIDSKVWKPGFMWTVGGTTRRGWQKFPYADKSTMKMAHDGVAAMLDKRGVHIPVHGQLVVWPSSKNGKLSTWALRVPGASVTTPEKFEGWVHGTAKKSRAVDEEAVSAMRSLIN